MRTRKWMRPVLGAMLVLAILAQPGRDSWTGYAAAAEPDSALVADADLERAVTLIDSLTFAVDSLTIAVDSLTFETGWLRGMMDISGGSAVPDSFWRTWKSWGTFFALGIVTGWALAR